MKKWIVSFFMLFTSVLAFSQVTLEKCLTEVFGAKQYGSIEAYYQHRPSTTSISANRSPITIPIVVHILWNDTKENISDFQIQSQIEMLNLDFSARNDLLEFIPNEYQELSIASRIQFCLAKIERKHTQIKNVGLAVDSSNHRIINHAMFGGLDPWDNAQYLNIWIGRMPSGALGYYFSDFGNKGIVIDPDAFGTIGSVKPNNSLGKTLTHEIGHFFGLNHIWGFGCEIDDGISDTPPQASPTSGCPNWPEWSCNSFDMYMNFMDYSFDRCLTLFTKEQITRMETVLNNKYPHFGEINCSKITTSPDLVALPNPVSENLILHIPRASNNEVWIYSSIGKLMYSTKITTPIYLDIPINNWPSGIYFLVVINGQQRTSQKISVINN